MINHTLADILDTDTQTIAIFGHTNIDGDCLGSILSLGSILESLGHTVHYRADEPGKSWGRLPDIEKISSNFDPSINYDRYVGVDFSPRSRMGKLYQSHQEFFDKLKDRILIIDHHIEDNYHATHNFKDSQADANCVWLYELLITAGWGQYITPQIAGYLYMGISTDTGNFIYDSQSTRVLSTATTLINIGADKEFYTHHLYRSTDPQALSTMTQMLTNYKFENHILLTYRDERDSGPMSKTQREVCSSFFQKIDGYDVFVLGTIKDDQTIKLSLRSKAAPGKTAVNVSELSQLYFHGGGHHMAAGGIYRHHTTNTQAIKDIFQIIYNHIHKT